jgi:hypothetical protein
MATQRAVPPPARNGSFVLVDQPSGYWPTPYLGVAQLGGHGGADLRAGRCEVVDPVRAMLVVVPEVFIQYGA